MQYIYITVTLYCLGNSNREKKKKTNNYYGKAQLTVGCAVPWQMVLSFIKTLYKKQLNIIPQGLYFSFCPQVAVFALMPWLSSVTNSAQVTK